jgi:hypothetical protein
MFRPRTDWRGIEKFAAKCEQLATRRDAVTIIRATRLDVEKTNALVAQLDRASDFDSEGREFESLRARQQVKSILFG